ncbi:aldo/keto reductase [Opitutales bacterium ASA1]|uniref:aldo/keto reductase n=1 Tax=Congregicoccus parvus TaxID=3081749 RepID=UPI002B3249A8|nr:aldo/keto reductase [Opitutales bacterium ASA1]
MQLRRCGRNGPLLSRIGLGTWAFGGGDYWGAQDQSDVDRVVRSALDLRINYFDTAEMYNAGASETSLGHALKGRRDEAVIGSKISPCHTRPDTLRERCEASLRRLRTDRIDVYMVHWPIHRESIRHFTDDPSAIENPPSTKEAFLTLADLQREGKIGHIGVSNFGVRQLREVLDLGVTLAVNELPYNLLMRGIERELVPFCRANGIGIIGYMTLMQGLLAGDYESFDHVPPVRLRTRHFSGERELSRHGEPGIEDQSWRAIVEIRAIAHDLGRPVSDVALAWALANPDVSCVLAGCRNQSQLEENVRAETLTLPPEAKSRLDAVTTEVLDLLGPNPDYYQSMSATRSW